MSESTVLNPSVSVVRPPINPPVQPCFRRADEAATPFPREHVDPDPEAADGRPQRWPRVFPGL